MPHVAIARIGAIGNIAAEDFPSSRVPPEGWTYVRNVRFQGGTAQRFLGDYPVMGEPTVVPAFVTVTENAGDTFWLYASAVGANSKVCAYNSGAHADISKTGNYTIADYRNWNATIFQGVPILNYGAGTPQYWDDYDLTHKLKDLPAWPASTTCKVLRSYGNYLIALNIIDTGGAYPHRIRWSDGAAPGTLPVTWDVTDPAYEAGELDATDVLAGDILDGYPLQDAFVIYKANSTWLLRYIGGQQIMSLKPVNQTSGVLCTRCVVPLQLPGERPEVHFVKTGDDLGIFDTKSFTSVVDKRNRKYIEANIDPRNFNNSFVFNHPAQTEAFFCFPESGATDPTLAAVWNYADNTITFREWTGIAAALGTVEGAATETWATASFTWDTVAPAAWQESSRQKLVFASPISGKLHQLDVGTTFNSVAFSSILERRDLAIIGIDREDNPIVDYNTRKLLSRIWPKITGGTAQIQVGGAEIEGEDVIWLPAVTFDPADRLRYVDCGFINTPMMAIRIILGVGAQLNGYGIDVEVVSEL
jgi:hypothetical protein